MNRSKAENTTTALGLCVQIKIVLIIAGFLLSFYTILFLRFLALVFVDELTMVFENHLFLLRVVLPQASPPNTPDRPDPPRSTTKGLGRHTYPTTVKKIRRRTTRQPISFEESCDYLAYYCLRAYKTGEVCARTLYYRYYNFENYCMMDYVNCMERYEVWQIAHMGQCYNISALTEYRWYNYLEDHFLDQYYVIDQ